MSTPGEIVIETGQLRLVRDAMDPQTGILAHAGRPLLRFLLRPEWSNDSPIDAARMTISAMRHEAPTLHMAGESKGLIGGLYCANSDAITCYRVEELTANEAASCLLHEAVHASGHRGRLNRTFFATAEPSNINADEYADPAREFALMPVERQREELTASIGAMLLCVILGIYPGGSAHWYRWTQHAAILPQTEQEAAIRDAVRAAAFILHGNAERPLWNAKPLS